MYEDEAYDGKGTRSLVVRDRKNGRQKNRNVIIKGPQAIKKKEWVKITETEIGTEMGRKRNGNRLRVKPG